MFQVLFITRDFIIKIFYNFSRKLRSALYCSEFFIRDGIVGTVTDVTATNRSMYFFLKFHHNHIYEKCKHERKVFHYGNDIEMVWIKI